MANQENPIELLKGEKVDVALSNSDKKKKKIQGQETPERFNSVFFWIQAFLTDQDNNEGLSDNARCLHKPL